MDVRPTALSDAEQREFEAYVSDLRTRVLTQVESILADLDDPVLQEAVYEIAFTPNDALPKRSRRPHLSAAHLAEQAYLANDPDGDRGDAVLQVAVLSQEYFDVLDDVADGDVADGHRKRVVAVSQALLPLLVERIARFGADAVRYWSERTARLVTAATTEATAEPSPETYLEVLAAQSHLYGTTTGLAAVAGGGDDDEVERAEDVGRTVYEYAQLALDLDQADGDGSETWNAVRLESRDAVLDRLAERQTRLADLLEPYPRRQSLLIRGLAAVDTNRWDERESTTDRDENG